MLTETEINELEAISFRVREHIIRMSGSGGCFIGASLSCADLAVYLYTQFLKVSPRTFEDPNRDYLLLSKGHDVPALYGTFVELGWLDPKRLQNHLKTTDDIYWHPNRKIPGVEFHSGSLGHLLPVAAGIAADCKLRGQSNRVVVITGDGELNEGSNWEALLVAQAHKLNNLVIVVDRNQFQANMRTEELIPLEPLVDKFESFGAQVMQVDGHDFNEMDRVFDQLPFSAEMPSVIIANTIRGKGLPSIAERADRWFCNFSDDEVDQLLAELAGTHSAEITSEPLVVR